MGSIRFIRVVVLTSLVWLAVVGIARGGLDTSWSQSSSDGGATIVDPPNAATALDQKQETDNGGGFFWNDRFFGQTFMPGVTGQLARVDVFADNWDNGPTLAAILSIVDTDASGAPSGPALRTFNLNWPAFGWTTFDLSSANLVLQKDHLYGMVFSNTDADYNTPPTDGLAVSWSSNLYPRGQLWAWSSATGWQKFNAFGAPDVSDMTFRTWMSDTVPEPGTLALLVGAPLLLVRRRRIPSRPPRRF